MSVFKRPDHLWGPPSIVFSGYRGSVLGERQTWYEAKQLPASTARVRNEWSYTSTPPIFPHGIDRTSPVLYSYKIIVRNCKVHFPKCIGLQDGLAIITN